MGTGIKLGCAARGFGWIQKRRSLCNSVLNVEYKSFNGVTERDSPSFDDMMFLDN